MLQDCDREWVDAGSVVSDESGAELRAVADWGCGVFAAVEDVESKLSLNLLPESNEACVW